jgi:hypothetical protein
VRSTIQLRTHKLERLPATFEDAKLIDGKRWLSLQVQRFADYGEPFRVNNDTLSTDPSPNDGNTLVVVYHANGQRIFDAVPEGEVFYFRSGRDTDYRPEYHKPGIRCGVPRLQGTLRRLTHRLRAYLLELAGACTFESATYEYIVLVNFAALRSSFH